MFQKLTIYKITAGLPADAADLAHALGEHDFTPTGATQDLSAGWIPPRTEHGAMVEAIAGHWIARLCIETRKVPSDALQRRIDEMVAKIEETTGRTPGRKERRDLKEEAVRELLPQAFPKRAHVPVWIDPHLGLLLIGATTQSVCDLVVTRLVNAVPDLAPRMFNTNRTPVGTMAAWLYEGETDNAYFDIGDACELKATDETKATVKYKACTLDTDEVKQHIQHGKLPTRLALNWKGRVAFTLSESLALHKIELLDVVFENSESKGDDAADHFDADAAIACGELSHLIGDLVDVLGGEMTEAPAPAPAKADSQPEPRAQLPITDEQRAKIERTAYNPDGDGVDPLIDRVRGLVLAHQKASISYVQRMLKINYNRAARLLEALEIEGVIGPLQSDGTRQIFTK